MEEVAEIFASLRDVDAALGRSSIWRAHRRPRVTARSISATARAGAFLRWEEARHADLDLPSFVEALRRRRPLLRLLRRAALHGLRRSRRRRRLNAALGLPMRHGGPLVGVLGLASRSRSIVPGERCARWRRWRAFRRRRSSTRARRSSPSGARPGGVLRRFGERALGTLDVAALYPLDPRDHGRARPARTRRRSPRSHGDACGWSPASARTSAGRPRGAGGGGQRGAVGDGPYIVDDVARPTRALLIKMARRNGAGSFMALAMRHDDRVLGHLFAGAAEIRRYRAEEVEAMRILSSMAAAVIEQRRAEAAASREAGRSGGGHRAPADRDRDVQRRRRAHAEQRRGATVCARRSTVRGHRAGSHGHARSS